MVRTERRHARAPEVDVQPLDAGRAVVFFRVGGQTVASGEISTRRLRQVIAAAESPTAFERGQMAVHDMLQRSLEETEAADASESEGRPDQETTAPSA